MNNLRDKLSMHYQEDIPDENLLDEAIATLENIFDYHSEDELLHCSRPLAIAYLALTYEKERKGTFPKDDV